MGGDVQARACFLVSLDLPIHDMKKGRMNRPFSRRFNLRNARPVQCG